MAGRPPAPVHVTNNILEANVLQTFECTPSDLYDCMWDSMQRLMWLAEHHVIHNNTDCVSCHQPVSLVGRAESPDGCSWNCGHWSSRTSIFTGSFFAHCIRSTQKIVTMLWLHEIKCKHVMFQNIESWDTIVNYSNFFHIECRNWLQTQCVERGCSDVSDSLADET